MPWHEGNPDGRRRNQLSITCVGNSFAALPFPHRTVFLQRMQKTAPSFLMTKAGGSLSLVSDASTTQRRDSTSW